MSEGKLQIGVYKIEEKNLDNLSAIIEEKGYSNQELENEEISGYRLKLYYQNKPIHPKWKDFFRSVAKANQDIFKKNKSWVEGFILLLFNKEKDNLYAVTGGPGYFIIQEHIYDDFGIDVFARLIKKEDKILKATKEKSVVGSVLGTTKHFRKNFNLFETDSFGKIYQELKANLDKKVLTDKLGFAENDIKKESVCIAKSSFKINKAISFEHLLKVIRGCESILETEQPISINNMEKLIKKKDQELIQSLDTELFNQLWQRNSEPQNSFAFDLCHRDFEKYLTASKYVVRKGTSLNNFFGEFEFEELNDIDTLFTKIAESEKKPENKEEFIKLMKSIKIYSYDEEDNDLTKGDLSAHLLGDVTHNNKKYFFIDKSWYRIKDAFINDLNEYCKSFINKNSYNGLDKNWNYSDENENQYNQKYIGEKNTIVLDKITPENIEPCDILKWDDNNLYLYHVKAGFGNTMRDLCSQIIIAANRINHDLNSSKEYIKKIYINLRKKIGGESYFDEAGKQTEIYSEDAFIRLFEKNLVFVLAVLDISNDRIRDIKNIEEFKSNIAKFSLQELTKEMKGIDVDFRITQIRKV